MTDQTLLHRLHNRVYDDGEDTPDHDARRGANEIDRLNRHVWFWRTLALVLVVVLIGVTAANAQGVTKEPPPGQWTTIPADRAPVRCNRIGDKTVCQSNGKVTTCYPIGQMLYCKEGY